MGTTLDNGIYLPDEGERNCYEGLAGNWVALDNHLGSTNIHVTINDKQAWDGHVADTTIHVTSADKQAWDGHVADSVKHVTAEDKAKWDVVTSKANDSDVVHKSGNETVSGVKTFSDNPVIGSNDANITVSNRQVTANSSYSAPTGSSYSFMQLKAIVNYVDSSPSIDATVGLSIQENAYSDGKRAGFTPNSNNTINLGLAGKRWANVYATNYYYGGSEIEFSQKFVTTDTSQTITYPKTFTSTSSFTGYASIRLYSQTDDVNVLPSAHAQRQIIFTDKNNVTIAYFAFQHRTDANEPFRTCWRQVRLDGTEGYYSVNFNNLGEFYPENNNGIKLGTSTKRWADCQTYLVNGLTPSSLSLPDLNNAVDISGYITDLAGSPNIYSPPANGYIILRSTTANALGIVENTTGMGSYSRGSNQLLAVYLPVVKNSSISIYAICSSLTQAKFIPCQGNV